MRDLQRGAAHLIHRGIGHVEFFDLEPDCVVDLGALLSVLRREGRERFSLHAPIARPDGFPDPPVACYFLSEEAELRARSFDLLDATLRIAARWGAEYVVTHLTFGPTDTHDRAIAERLARSACEHIAEMSDAHRLPIDIEFAAYSDAFHRPAQFLSAIEGLDMLGVCIDVGHAALGARARDRDLLFDIRSLAQRARSLHLWNTRGDSHEHVPLNACQSPEDGWIDLEAVFDELGDALKRLTTIFEYPVEELTPDIQAGYDWAEQLVERATAIAPPDRARAPGDTTLSTTRPL